MGMPKVRQGKVRCCRDIKATRAMLPIMYIPSHLPSPISHPSASSFPPPVIPHRGSSSHQQLPFFSAPSHPHAPDHRHSQEANHGCRIARRRASLRQSSFSSSSTIQHHSRINISSAGVYPGDPFRPACITTAVQPRGSSQNDRHCHIRGIHKTIGFPTHLHHVCRTSHCALRRATFAGNTSPCRSTPRRDKYFTKKRRVRHPFSTSSSSQLYHSPIRSIRPLINQKSRVTRAYRRTSFWYSKYLDLIDHASVSALLRDVGIRARIAIETAVALQLM
jgi:hypothetical protein